MAVAPEPLGRRLIKAPTEGGVQWSRAFRGAASMHKMTFAARGLDRAISRVHHMRDMPASTGVTSIGMFSRFLQRLGRAEPTAPSSGARR